MSETAELIGQIASLTGRIERLEAQLEAQSEEQAKKEGFKLWEPADEEKHYYVNSLGCWELGKRTYAVDDRRISNFNCYKTQEIAQQEAKWLRAARKLRALARQLNPEGWKYDDQAFYIILDTGELYTLDWSVGANCGQVLFHSREAAQTALDNLTEDEREVLFGS